jgi:hypothetical protein
MSRIHLASLMLCMIVTGSDASPLLPYEGVSIDLGGLHGVAYYSEQPDGFHVVATVAEGEQGLPVRFEATLADHQKLTISVPRAAGEPPRLLELSRSGTRLVMKHDRVSDLSCPNDGECPAALVFVGGKGDDRSRNGSPAGGQ